MSKGEKPKEVSQFVEEKLRSGEAAKQALNVGKVGATPQNHAGGQNLAPPQHILFPYFPSAFPSSPSVAKGEKTVAGDEASLRRGGSFGQF